MENQFIVGVADVRLYDENDDLVCASKTMLNTSIEISTSSTEISGGKRNKLLNVYYHSGRLNLSLEDTAFNMEWIRDNVGGKLTTAVVPFHETKTIVSGLNTLTKTAKKFDGSDSPKVYIDGKGYEVDGNNKFEAPDFVNEKVCVEYFVEDENAVSYTIPASIMPERLRAILNVDMASNKQGEGVIGEFIIEIPVLQLSGAQTINMTADGYSKTPLSGMALAFTPEGGDDPCESDEVYAIITKRLNKGNWYDNVNALAVIEGDFEAEAGTTHQLQIRATTTDGMIKSVVMSDLTFGVTGGSGISVGEHTGLVTLTSEASGSAYIKAYITAKPNIETNVVCTVASEE